MQTINCTQSHAHQNKQLYILYTHLTALFSGTTRLSWYQKDKANLDFTEARDSGISWVIWKSAPCSRQITMPAPHHSVFIGRMPFLPPNQQRQSTEGNVCNHGYQFNHYVDELGN